MTVYVLVVLIMLGPRQYISEVVEVFTDEGLCNAIAAEMDNDGYCLERIEK